MSGDAGNAPDRQADERAGQVASAAPRPGRIGAMHDLARRLQGVD